MLFEAHLLFFSILNFLFNLFVIVFDYINFIIALKIRIISNFLLVNLDE